MKLVATANEPTVSAKYVCWLTRKKTRTLKIYKLTRPEKVWALKLEIIYNTIWQ